MSTDAPEQTNKKSFGDWLDDTLLAMQVFYVRPPTTNSMIPTRLIFLWQRKQQKPITISRQWLEWNGRPCSNYAYWYFQARWKDQQVTLKDVGQGSITLPQQAFYKKP